MKVKTKRMEFGFIALQIGGNTLQGLWRKRGLYMSDTFTNYYKSITEAKRHTQKLAEDGYFGDVIKKLALKGKQK